MSNWDQLSCQDRLDQIRDQLTQEEMSVLLAFLQQMGGTSVDRMGLLDALRWWALGSHTQHGLNNIALHTRLRSGNSELHRRMFLHALSTGNLSYSFQTPVASIEEDEGGIVTATTREGTPFKGKAVITTIPLNVLSSIAFSPPLAREKQEAAREGSVNKCNKVHVDLIGPDYLSWSSMASPGKGLVTSFGDQLTPADNSHLVCFGPDPNISSGINLDDIESVKDAVLHMLPKNKRSHVILNRIVSTRRDRNVHLNPSLETLEYCSTQSGKLQHIRTYVLNQRAGHP